MARAHPCGRMQEMIEVAQRAAAKLHAALGDTLAAQQEQLKAEG